MVVAPSPGAAPRRRLALCPPLAFAMEFRLVGVPAAQPPVACCLLAGPQLLAGAAQQPVCVPGLVAPPLQAGAPLPWRRCCPCWRPSRTAWTGGRTSPFMTRALPAWPRGSRPLLPTGCPCCWASPTSTSSRCGPRRAPAGRAQGSPSSEARQQRPAGTQQCPAPCTPLPPCLHRRCKSRGPAPCRRCLTGQTCWPRGTPPPPPCPPATKGLMSWPGLPTPTAAPMAAACTSRSQPPA